MDDLVYEADSLGSIGQYDSAIVLFEKSLDSAEILYGFGDSTTAYIVKRLGRCKQYAGKPDDAERLYKGVIADMEKEHETDADFYFYYLNILSSLYLDLGRYTEVDSLLGNIIDSDKYKDYASNQYATLIGNAAHSFDQQGKYAEAEYHFKWALAVLEKLHGQNDPSLTESFTDLGSFYFDHARYVLAEDYFRKALELRRSISDTVHSDFAHALMGLAAINRVRSNFSEAEYLLNRVLPIWEEIYDPYHNYVIYTLNLLATIYMDQGKFAEAGIQYKRALSILRQISDFDLPVTATTLNNLGTIYRVQGLGHKAEQYYLEALEMRERLFKPGNPEIAISLNNLGVLYLDQRRYKEAEIYMVKALENSLLSIDSTHPYVLTNLSNLASVYQYQDLYTKADSLYSIVFNILESRNLMETPMSAMLSVQYANLKVKTGDINKAVNHLYRAINLCELIYDRDHPNWAHALESLCNLYRMKDEIDSALVYSRRSLDMRIRFFESNAYSLNEKDALSFAWQLYNSIDIYLSVLSDSKADAYTIKQDDLKRLMKSKGVVSDEMFFRRKNLAFESDSVTQNLLEKYRFAVYQLSSELMGEPGIEYDKHKQRIDSLQRIADSFEVELSVLSKTYANHMQERQFEVNDVRLLLPDNSMLVEYFKFNYIPPKPQKASTSKYLVLGLNADGSAEVVELGLASKIDNIVSKYRKHMTRVSSLEHAPETPDHNEYREIARELYSAVVKPLETQMKGIERIIFSPDGALNLVSFAGLIDDDSNYLIENHQIHYVQAGRDLNRLKQKSGSGEGLLAMADPDFNASIEDILNAVETETYAAVVSSSFNLKSNTRSTNGKLHEMTFQPLPYTRVEVQTIVDNWNSMNKSTASAYYGCAATEDAFNKEAPGKQVIHLSTHGYYLESKSLPDNEMDTINPDEAVVEENPLLQSGLVFAGCNLHGEGTDSAGLDDGFLSAYEVSAMDLQGVDIVVLSACETGLGRVEEGEGVYGLRRSFQLAGARTVISALWKVNDKITSTMMSLFYTKSDRIIPERMREMQLELIGKLRQHDLPDHPLNWAGFIAIGDWIL
jgi:CHAT domain-containing protein/tetratricopeptide (TPR) repeat protein